MIFGTHIRDATFLKVEIMEGNELVPGCSSHFGIDSTFGEDSIIDDIDEREERDISSSCESV